MEIPSLLREITCHMGSHSITCHPAAVTFLPLPQPKLVLDLATPEECEAELTWVVVTFQDSLCAKDGRKSRSSTSYHLPSHRPSYTVISINTVGAINRLPTNSLYFQQTKAQIKDQDFMSLKMHNKFCFEIEKFNFD